MLKIKTILATISLLVLPLPSQQANSIQQQANVNVEIVIANQSQAPSSVRDPLIYPKLRFDRDFLQIYRRFQKHLKLDEEKIVVKYNESVSDGSSSKAAVGVRHQSSFEYYINREVDSSQISQDDLIFEALERTYLTRLMPINVFNYDKPADRQRASDSKLVSKQRCRRDMAFLMNQLQSIQRARQQQQQQQPTEPLMMSSEITPELLAFFDSFASEEPGLLMGNHHWPGNWRQCQKRRIIGSMPNEPDPLIQFKGRYCIGSLRNNRWNQRISQRMLELKKHFKYPEQKYDYARFFRIQVGICLPESCDSTLIEQQPDDVHTLTTFKLSEPIRSYELSDLYCLPDETSELRQLETGGKLFIGFMLIWLTLISLCTVYDLIFNQHASDHPKTPEKFIEKLVESMSLTKNIYRLIETQSCQLKSQSQTSNQVNKPTILADNEPSSQQKREQVVSCEPSATKSTTTTTTTLGKQVARHQQQRPKIDTMATSSSQTRLQPNDLLFLYAIKVISMPMIIFGHAGMLFKHLDRMALDYDGLDSDFVFHFQASTPFFVDWYFVITGFLTTYVMFVTRKVERNTLTQWLYTIFHRYWRLAPLYILLFWFSQSVFMYTSSGPLWDYGTSNMTLRSICRRESWLWPLTLTSNLHPLHEECIMPAWYIACDMQFYLITPFMLILLRKSPLMGWLAAIGTIGACISLRLHRYLTDERAQPLELMRPRYDLYMRNNWDMHPTYVYPQYRISTYLVGILAGHYTYMVLSGQWNSIMYTNLQASRSGESTTTIRTNRGKHKSTPTGGGGGTSTRLAAFIRFLACSIGLIQLIAMMFATWLISDLFPVNLEKHVKYFTALIYSFDHVTAGLGMALVLVTLMFGFCKPLRQFLSHPNWAVMSRVNFIVYLSQVEWIYWLVQSADHQVDLSSLELFKMFFYLCCAVYLFATICTVLFELPLAQLEKNFVGSIFMSRPKSMISISGKKSSETSESSATRQVQQVGAEMTRLMTSTSHA